MIVTVVGAGYVGLVTGACLADFGHNVVCIDQDAAKIASLNAGEIPIFEPGLQELVAKGRGRNLLSFSTDLASAVADSDVVFIAVGTPPRAVDGRADVSSVHEVARQIGRTIRGYTVVVTKSTVPVGTGDEVERIITSVEPEFAFSVVSNPEFLREGSAISDFRHPDRVVIGAEDDDARRVMHQIYGVHEASNAAMIYTSRKTAEMIKYAANAFLALKITFINEMADLCERAGADIVDLALGVGKDRRIGRQFLDAGPGYGGSCFPKDTMALALAAQDYGSPLRLVETVVNVNASRKRAMAMRVIACCGGSVRGKTIALLGLTFKPNTDDVREAPALVVAQALRDYGAHVRAYDPKGVEGTLQLMPDLDVAEDALSACRDADAVVIMTEWEEFRRLDLAKLRASVRSAVLVDLRNVVDPQRAADHGFLYFGIGRGETRRPSDTIFKGRMAVRTAGA